MRVIYLFYCNILRFLNCGMVELILPEQINWIVNDMFYEKKCEFKMRFTEMYVWFTYKIIITY